MLTPAFDPLRIVVFHQNSPDGSGVRDPLDKTALLVQSYDAVRPNICIRQGQTSSAIMSRTCCFTYAAASVVIRNFPSTIC